jgi:hypothetical protein
VNKKRFAWWNHYFDFEAVVPGALDRVYVHLCQYYGRGAVTPEDPPKRLRIDRGSVLNSLLLGGSEKWCRHALHITLSPQGSESVVVSWHINLKLFGWVVGRNALTKECQDVVESLSRRAEPGAASSPS